MEEGSVFLWKKDILSKREKKKPTKLMKNIYKVLKIKYSFFAGFE